MGGADNILWEMESIGPNAEFPKPVHTASLTIGGHRFVEQGQFFLRIRAFSSFVYILQCK